MEIWEKKRQTSRIARNSVVAAPSVFWPMTTLQIHFIIINSGTLFEDDEVTRHGLLSQTAMVQLNRGSNTLLVWKNLGWKFWNQADPEPDLPCVSYLQTRINYLSSQATFLIAKMRNDIIHPGKTLTGVSRDVAEDQYIVIMMLQFTASNSDSPVSTMKLHLRRASGLSLWALWGSISLCDGCCCPEVTKHARFLWPPLSPGVLLQIHVHWVGDPIYHLILWHPPLLLPSISPSIRVFPARDSSSHQVDILCTVRCLVTSLSSAL